MLAETSKGPSGKPDGPQIADKVPYKALVFHGGFVLLWGMLREREGQQHEMEMVTIESLVPADHLLRRIDASIDLEFIRERGDCPELR